MDETEPAVRADVQLHVEMPFVALLRLVHFRVARLLLFSWFLVEGGAAIRVASMIVPPESFMPLARGSSPNLGEHRRTQFMFLQQVAAKVGQSRGIGHPFASQVDAAEFPEYGRFKPEVFR